MKLGGHMFIVVVSIGSVVIWSSWSVVCINTDVTSASSTEVVLNNVVCSMIVLFSVGFVRSVFEKVEVSWPSFSLEAKQPSSDIGTHC